MIRILAITLALLACARAAAQTEEPTVPSPAPDSGYEVALSEALAAHARGDYAQARLFMERAHQLEPSARTLRGLGIVAFAQGRHLDAIRFLDASLLSADKPLPTELRSSVEELLGHAWGQVGKYELLIDPPSGDFLIDGKEPDLYAQHTVVLFPGNHLLTARAPARAPYELNVAVKPGEQRTLQVVLAVPPAPRIVAEAAPGPKADPIAPRADFWKRRGRWLALGTGGALVVTGAALWTVAYQRLDGIADDCRNHVDGFCTRREATKAYRRENVQGLGIAAGTALGIGAAVLIGTGIVELLQHRKRDLRLSAGLGSLALHGTF